MTAVNDVFSAFNVGRFGSALSVLDLAVLGSTLSIRSFVKIGKALSVLDYTHLGSTLSIRNYVKLGSKLSVLDMAMVGSSLSIRNMGRIGSSFSVVGFSNFGSALSVLDFLALGSAMSLRGLARLGSSLSVVDYAHMGSALSLRSFARFGSQMSVKDDVKVGGSPRLFGTTTQLYLDGSTGQTYIKFDGTTVEVYNQNNKRLSVTTSGGTLHGTWSSDAALTSSDRRLKTTIEPLYRTIAERWPGSQTATTSSQALPAGPVPGPARRQSAESNLGRTPSKSAMSWLLRELRPVSFYLKRGTESKKGPDPADMKFGFIAQEVEGVLPNLVKETGEAKTKMIAYQDFIAILTLTAQTHQDELAELRALVKTQQQQIDRIERLLLTQLRR
jgi:acyl-[acyl carrier protein]--UDP-N-acetylglucosamine O-acyltransferase